MSLSQETAGPEGAGKRSERRASCGGATGDADPGAFVADILAAVLSLEYGAVTVSVKGGRVVRLERHEKQRLPNPKRVAQPAP